MATAAKRERNAAGNGTEEEASVLDSFVSIDFDFDMMAY